ncbi:glycerate kinase [uncultured Chloroflexus sp.]|uniref:glycerate kinase n=1 Tax=uncultured Chloroflexus sp. TaxID=214040 RepID=UPI00260C7C18|nr:glycerate kinase [uncultured Chloroflexus sp.]
MSEALVSCQNHLVDGGECFSKTLVSITGGSLDPVTVTGLVGQLVDAHIDLLGGLEPRTAVLEMAAAAGLRLVPRDQRNPLVTTTYGKIPAEVARRAQDYRVLVIALAGTIGHGASINQQHGISAYTSVLSRPMALEEAIAEAFDLVVAQAEQVMRMVMVGQRTANNSRASRYYLHMAGQ